MRRDLILSSGFLAFARHVGFLAAVEEARLPVGAVCGTSSGALVAALWASGMPAEKIAGELSTHPPVRWLRPGLRPWRGLFRIEPVVERLRQLLPRSFDELPRPLAVGVLGEGVHRFLHQGPLPEAVAASCAIPVVFQPVALDGVRYRDGGSVDRLGLAAWRAWRPGRAGFVHWVDGTRGREVEASLEGLEIVRTPASGASFFDLGDFAGQMRQARLLASRVAATLVTTGGRRSLSSSPTAAPSGWPADADPGASVSDQ